MDQRRASYAIARVLVVCLFVFALMGASSLPAIAAPSEATDSQATQSVPLSQLADILEESIASRVHSLPNP